MAGVDAINVRMVRPVLEGGYIPGLDGVRALSVCLVMISHYGFGRFVPGGTGITVFFFLSGFLITSLLFQERNARGHVGILYFYARRFLRLAPELFAYLALSTLVGMLYDAHPSIPDLGAALLYLTNYYGIFLKHFGAAIRWPHLWSLAVEEHYYLTYPALVTLMLWRPKRLLAILVVVCCLALAWRIASFALGFSFVYIGIASETRLDSIAYGCITAVLLTLSQGRLMSPRAAIVTSVVGWALLLLSLALREPFFRETFRYSVQGLGLMGVFFGLFMTKTYDRLVDLLEAKPLRWMGRMSYAAYLWHLEAIILYGHFEGKGLESAPFATRVFYASAFVAATFLLAYLSNVFIFQPTRAWRQRFSVHHDAPLTTLSAVGP